MIKNILWDVDGTLFDTYPAITYSLSKSLNELGKSMALNVIDGLVRQSFDHCVESLSQRFKLDPGLLCRLAREHYLIVPMESQPPFDEVKEVCAYIHEHGGLNIGVTHRAVDSTKSLLDVHNFSVFFDGIISTEEGYPRKPDPAMFETALRQFKLERAETMAIGDRALDIQAGQAAGLQTCLFGRAQISEPADIQIDHYGQLLNYLDKQVR